ncbi:unnamed protein product [Fraxinus pennsylvanica]|uniref:Uncharacterized protein n=1 Tax=Fraxinus pennsylvanica TaxID=56036 RepID=A0AAD1YYA6_9LAMI|nr:unnamed protein product [Fraxinus pennsylvanica]
MFNEEEFPFQSGFLNKYVQPNTTTISLCPLPFENKLSHISSSPPAADIVQLRFSPVTGSFSRDLSLEADVSESNAGNIGADPKADQTVADEPGESDGNNTVAVYGDVNSNSQDCLHNVGHPMVTRRLGVILDACPLLLQFGTYQSVQIYRTQDLWSASISLLSIMVSTHAISGCFSPRHPTP